MKEDLIKKSRIFHKNLKGAIKKRGYEIVSFPEKHLGCTYQAFNWRLKEGRFLWKDTIICMEVLDVTFEDLMNSNGTKIATSPLVRKKPKFSKLNTLLN